MWTALGGRRRGTGRFTDLLPGHITGSGRRTIGDRHQHTAYRVGCEASYARCANLTPGTARGRVPADPYRCRSHPLSPPLLHGAGSRIRRSGSAVGVTWHLRGHLVLGRSPKSGDRSPHGAWSERCPRSARCHAHPSAWLQPVSLRERSRPSPGLRPIASLLYATSPWDARTFGGMILLLVLVALVSGYMPARRASGIEPMSALRTQ